MSAMSRTKGQTGECEIANILAAELGSSDLGTELATKLQRCDGFSEGDGS